MSYSLNVIQDRAIGYWSFSGNLNDLTSASNTASGGGLNYTSPPIITIGGSAMKLTSSTSSVQIGNSSGNYEFLSANYSKNPVTISFWFTFNNQLNGSGAGTTPYKSNQLKFVTIKNKANTITIATIYYDYLTNTIRFSFPGANNSDAYIVLDNHESHFYVVASYNKNSISINVNGVEGVGGSVNDTTNMDSVIKTNLILQIDGSSITGSSTLPINYLINSLSIFNYQLNLDQIKKHFLWAFNDGKPKYQALTNTNTSQFLFEEIPSEYADFLHFSGDDFKSYGKLNNLVVGNGGLNPIIVTKPYFYSFDGISASSINSTSGVTWNNLGAVIFDTPELYFNLTSGFSITTQISNRSSSANQILFSLSNLTDEKNIYLGYNATSSAYTISEYDNYTASTTILGSTTFATVSPSANIALSFSSGSIFTYISENSVTASILVPDISYTLQDASSIEIGNANYNQKTFDSYIKNFNMSSTPITTSSAFNLLDFISASTIMFRFTNTSNPFLISSYGSWEYLVPTSMFNDSPINTQVDWSSMDNCNISVSLDGGSTYNTVVKNQPITNYNLLGTNSNIKFKVSYPIEYDVETKFQTFFDLSYLSYNDLSLMSDGEGYVMYPVTGNGFLNPYNFKINGLSLLSRPQNFGIKFFSDSNKKAGSASISVPSTSSYNAIEFWYRPDNLPSQLLRTNMFNFPSFEYTAIIYINRTTAITGAFLTGSVTPLYGASVMGVTGLLINNQTRISFYNNQNATTAAEYIFHTSVPGTKYTMSAYIKDVATPTGSVIARIQYYNSTASTVVLSTASSFFPVSTSSWTRVYITASAPISSTSSLNGDRFVSSILAGSTTVVTGLQYYIDGVLIEQSNYLQDYFDGNSTGASWTGTTNRSKSTIYGASAANYILNNVSGSALSPAIWINRTGKFQSLGGTLYINGASVQDNTYSPIIDDLYHLTLSLSSPNTSDLYLNGYTWSNTSIPSTGTYGYLQIWNSSPSSSDILNRYNSFIQPANSTVIMDNINNKIYSPSTRDYYLTHKIGI